MFKNLTITGFRGISNLSITDFKRVNLVVGRNNVGKTSLLEAMFILTNPGNPGLPALVTNMRSRMIIDSSDWSFFFNDLDIKKAIKLRAELTSPREERSAEIRPHLQSNAANAFGAAPLEAPLTQQFKSSFSGAESSLSGLDLEVAIKEPGAGKKPMKFSVGIEASPNLVSGISPMGAPIAYPSLNQRLAPNYRETLKAVLSSPVNVYQGTSVRFGKLQVAKRVDRVLQVLQQIDDSIRSLTLGPDGYIYVDTGLPTFIPINLTGDGLQRVLAYTLAMFEAENGVALLDEVENGCHPSIQGAIWEALIGASRDFNTQVIATTHSVDCVRALYQASQKLSADEEIRLFRLEKVSGELKAISFDRKNLSTALNSGWEIR